MTCIKCQKLKPLMISMCADCYKANMADQLRFKKACDIGGALAEKLNRIRKQVEALRDKAEKERENPTKFTRPKEASSGAMHAYQNVLDLIDAEQKPLEGQ